MVDQTKIGVVGAGTMGAGIAQVAAQSGFQTVLYDISQEFIDRGLGRIRGFIQRSRERGRLTPVQEKEILGRLTGSLQLEDMSDSCLVVEAVPETIELKREIFQKLDTICAPETLIATNTSSLSVTTIAAVTKHPERAVGMHFFNPPPLMALVEVIQGGQSRRECVEQAVELVRKLGKTPVLTQDTPGFVVNRIARPFYNEALRILGDGGAKVETIDRIMKEVGKFRMGPFELMDLIGNDVNFTATNSLYEAFFHDPRFRPSPIQHRMFEAGLLGRKTGKGFYTYESK